MIKNSDRMGLWGLGAMFFIWVVWISEIVERIRRPTHQKNRINMAMSMAKASEWKQVTYKKVNTRKATNEKATSAAAAGGADRLQPAQARHAQWCRTAARREDGVVETLSRRRRL